MVEVTSLRPDPIAEVFVSPHRAALFRRAVEKGDKFTQVRLLNEEVGERIASLSVAHG